MNSKRFFIKKKNNDYYCLGCNYRLVTKTNKAGFISKHKCRMRVLFLLLNE
jgi:hypothetical protein